MFLMLLESSILGIEYIILKFFRNRRLLKPASRMGYSSMAVNNNESAFYYTTLMVDHWSAWMSLWTCSAKSANWWRSLSWTINYLSLSDDDPGKVGGIESWGRCSDSAAHTCAGCLSIRWSSPDGMGPEFIRWVAVASCVIEWSISALGDWDWAGELEAGDKPLAAHQTIISL